MCGLNFLFSFRHSSKLLSILLALAYFFLTPNYVLSAQGTLSWDANTDPNVAGYKIYYGTASQNYQTFINVGNVTSYTVTNLQDGMTYYFVATCYSSSDESPYSNEVSFTTPLACSFGISPASQTVGSAGITGTVNLTAGAGCAWTAFSNVSWITITSNSSGTGNETVNFTVDANSGSTLRTGTMTIAGKTFTVTQSGDTLCSYTISPTSSSFNFKAGTGSISVTAGSGCSWSASSSASWITITSGDSKTGNGTVNYSVPANTSSTSRTGTMTIAEKTFTVTQRGNKATK